MSKPESTAPEFLTGLGCGWAGRRRLVCTLTASSGRPCRLVEAIVRLQPAHRPPSGRRTLTRMGLGRVLRGSVGQVA